MDQQTIWDEGTATWLLKRAKPAGMICVLDEDIWFLVKQDTKKKGKYRREEVIDIEKRKNITSVVKKLVASQYLKFDGNCERIDCRMKRYILTKKGIEFQNWGQERKNYFKRHKPLENKQHRIEGKVNMTKRSLWSWEEAEYWQKLVFAAIVIVIIYGVMNVLMLFF